MGERDPRPRLGRPADYDEVLFNFTHRGVDALVRSELLEMAEGGNPKGGSTDENFKGVREEFYKDWKNEDFRALLLDLGFSMPDKLLN